ncbi:unnamed protein product [Allacma fusca]|uniref:FLYWCH-type domain-containing protein n=1 Tax=Allacma fusca TaxID=39272 RepID=A0A8J2KPS6_9HEXA|nr:unnamed protein product [Allacma fusca]
MSSLAFGQRKTYHLLHEGYRYCLKRSLKNCDKVWECCFRKSRLCVGKYVSRSGEVIETRGTHNHSSSLSDNEAFQVVAAIKDRASRSHVTPANIVADALSARTDHVITSLPLERTLTRLVRKVRHREDLNEPRPLSLVDLVIPDRLKVTQSGEPFLLSDSGPGPQRILLFSTKHDLSILAENNDWYMDGTFKVAPHPFCQLYTIHGFRLHASLPTLFALLPNKSEETYNRLFSTLKGLQNGLAPRSLMTDFEQGPINAFREAFPQTEIRGYRTIADFALKMRTFAALSFVPPEHVKSYYMVLKREPFVLEGRQMEEFVQYFEETWIGTPARRGTWRSSRFEPQLWNMYHSVLTDTHRTNNNIEGWHSRFESLIGAHHPMIWKFIQVLQKEQNVTRAKTIQFLAGAEPPPSKKKYRLLNSRLKMVVEDFNNRTVMDYLRSISYNLSFAG